MKSSLCLIHGRRTASFGIVGLMLTITSLGLMLAFANPSALAQASADVSNAGTSPAPSRSDWSQFHRDNMQRWNPYEAVLGVGNVGNLQLKWRKSIGIYIGGLQSLPTVANGAVYFGTNGSGIYAVNADTGAQLWNYPS
jgi:glucose dehydrogenase